jgi:hypothetical protein
MDDAFYESHFDEYGQPLAQGWGPYLSLFQRSQLLERLERGATLTPSERFIISSGQLGADAAAVLGGGAHPVQVLPGMTITATLPALGVLILAYLFLRRSA